MITVEIFAHETNDGKVIFEESDFRVVNISTDDALYKGDFEELQDFVMANNCWFMAINKWHWFCLKRIYADNGTGQTIRDGFELEYIEECK